MTAKKKKRMGKHINFLDIHDSFTDNMKSLEAFVDNIAPVAKRLDRTELKEIDKLGKEIVRFVLGVKRISKTKLEKFEIDEEGAKKIIEDKDKAAVMNEFLRKMTGMPVSQAQLLYRGSFVMLMSYFDFLLSDLISCFYKKYPENLSKKESPSLTLSDFNLSNTIDDAVDLIISKEVENVLRKRLEEQKLYLRDRLKFDTKDNIINWDKIVESMERRHVIVHNNCKINKRYLSSADLSQAPEKNKDLKEGKAIIITED